MKIFLIKYNWDSGVDKGNDTIILCCHSKKEIFYLFDRYMQDLHMEDWSIESIKEQITENSDYLIARLKMIEER